MFLWITIIDTSNHAEGGQGMKDWKGNEVQVGDTVLLVATGSMFDGSVLISSMWDGEKYVERQISDPIPKSYSFDIEGKYLITEPSNLMTIYFDPKITQPVPIDQADFYIAKQPWHIICIEGKSDNEKEYYQHYFDHE